MKKAHRLTARLQQKARTDDAIRAHFSGNAYAAPAKWAVRTGSWAAEIGFLGLGIS
jgi:hypothetical protein